MEKNNQKGRIAGGVDKPENPYRKGSLIWSVMEGEWEDLTMAQIAEVLGTVPNTVRTCVSKIERETGYNVPRTSGRGRR